MNLRVEIKLLLQDVETGQEYTKNIVFHRPFVPDCAVKILVMEAFNLIRTEMTPSTENGEKILSVTENLRITEVISFSAEKTPMPEIPPSRVVH